MTGRLFDQMQRWRRDAANLYDRLVAEGLRKEEVADRIRGISVLLHEHVKKAAHKDLAAVADAVWRFGAQAHAYEEVAREYLNRAQNERDQVKILKGAVLERMEKEGVTILTEGPLSFSRTTVGGVPDIIIR